MKSLLNPEDGAPVSEEISQRSTQRAHRAAKRGAWRIAGDLPSSFRYAAQGLGYGFVSQRNFRIHVCTGALVLGMGIWLQLASDCRVERNDALSLEEIRDLNPSAILLSPGPGDPDQAGVCLEVLRQLSPTIPTLGVCLGHQSLAQAYGGRVVRASELMHGKTSPVQHRGEGVFAGLPQPLTATRYHSLIAERDTLPNCLEVTAWLEDGTIMGLRHRDYPHLQGVQFHPESVLTEAGHQLLANFLRQAEPQ